MVAKSDTSIPQTRKAYQKPTLAKVAMLSAIAATQVSRSLSDSNNQ